jgi:hypothetical protein
MNGELEWYSLPMYLSSRFGIALWTSFGQRDTNRTSWSDPIQGAIENLPEPAFRNALVTAAVATLQKDILATDSASVRDGLMWNLLDPRWMQDVWSRQGARLCWTNVGTVTIVELKSSKHTVQKSLWYHLQEAIAIETKKDILRSLNSEMPTVHASALSKRNMGKKQETQKGILCGRN